MPERRRTVRRSQTLSPFGVGAIYDVVGESLVAADITTWPPAWTHEKIEMPRLAATLHGIDNFRAAPPAPSQGGDGRGLRYLRFPRWMFCQRCRAMRFWTTRDEEASRYPEPRCDRARCQSGGKPPQLAPMRWVQICDQGHLDDVDWAFWVHSGGDRSCRSRRLSFISTQGTSLASLRVTCEDCSRTKDLEDLPRKTFRCRGLQPWQRIDDAESCQAHAKAVQRGGSNVHFPTVVSAIDIPPWSVVDITDETATTVRNHVHYGGLADATDQGNDLLAGMLLRQICTDLDVDQSYVIALLKGEGVGSQLPEPPADPDAILRDEWIAFRTPVSGQPRDRFITHVTPLSHNGSSPLEPLVDRVIVADRLREVRALQGFTRLSPGGRLVPPDLGGAGRQDWLPAIEVFGEGLFLSLDEAAVRAWERQSTVLNRVAGLERRRAKSEMSARLSDTATPRMILLHTLAHLLIRQLTFECGYSSASLRERIYASDDHANPMAGLLIYTASGDSEGTLGGLARQGDAPRLSNTTMTALNRASWCSTDPICIESTGQGMGALNLGACHGCTLVSETSCTSMNSLLDRGLLLGWTDATEMGFFSQLIDRAELEHVL